MSDTAKKSFLVDFFDDGLEGGVGDLSFLWKDLKKEITAIVNKHRSLEYFVRKQVDYYVRSKAGWFHFQKNYDTEDFAYENGLEDEIVPIEVTVSLNKPYSGSMKEYTGRKYIHVYGFNNESEMNEFLDEFSIKVCYTCGRPYSYVGTKEQDRCYCATCSKKYLGSKYKKWNLIYAKEEGARKIVGLNSTGFWLDNREVEL